MEENQPQQIFSLTIDPLTKSHLNGAASWARFLAIAGIILLSLGMLAIILTLTVLPNAGFMKFTMNGMEQTNMNNTMKATSAFFMIVVFLIAFFPLLFLLRFASQMKRALHSNNQQVLNDSCQNLKRYFRYIGVIMVIVLVFYALAIIMLALGATAMH